MDESIQSKIIKIVAVVAVSLLILFGVGFAVSGQIVTKVNARNMDKADRNHAIVVNGYEFYKGMPREELDKIDREKCSFTVSGMGDDTDFAQVTVISGKVYELNFKCADYDEIKLVNKKTSRSVTLGEATREEINRLMEDSFQATETMENFYYDIKVPSFIKGLTLPVTAYEFGFGQTIPDSVYVYEVGWGAPIE